MHRFVHRRAGLFTGARRDNPQQRRAFLRVLSTKRRRPVRRAPPAVDKFFSQKCQNPAGRGADRSDPSHPSDGAGRKAPCANPAPVCQPPSSPRARHAAVYLPGLAPPCCRFNPLNQSANWGFFGSTARASLRIIRASSKRRWLESRSIE